MSLFCFRQRIRLIGASSADVNFPVSHLIDDRLSYIHATTSLSNQYIEFSTREFLVENLKQAFSPGSGTYASIDIHPNGQWVIDSDTANNRLRVRAFNQTTGQIGATAHNFTSQPRDVGCVKFSPNGNYLLCVFNQASGTDPGFTIYNFNSTTGQVGSRLSNPATFDDVVTGIGGNRGGAWMPNGRGILFIHGASPWYDLHPFDPDTGVIGNALTHSATNPTGAPAGCAFHPVLTLNSSSNWFAIAHATSPFVTVTSYTVDSSGNPTAIVAKIANPASLPGAAGRSVAWNPAGTYIIMTQTSSPWAYIYPWSGGAFGVRLSDPATSVGAQYDWVGWGNNGLSIILCGNTATPKVYIFTGSAWGSPETFWVSTLANARGAGAVISPNGTLIAFFDATDDLFNVYDWNEGYDATNKPLRWLHLVRTNWKRTAKVRVRGSNNRDMSSPVYDPDGAGLSFAWSQSKITQDIFDRYPHDFKRLLSADTQANYWRIDISDPDQTDTALVASYLIAGEALLLENEQDFGEEFVPDDPTTFDRSKGGVDYLNVKPIRRTWSGVYAGVLNNEVYGELRALVDQGIRVKLSWAPYEDDDLSNYIDGFWGRPTRPIPIVRSMRRVKPDGTVFSLNRIQVNLAEEL